MRSTDIGTRRLFWCLVIAGLVGLSACAGEPAPTAQLALAKQAVDEATRSGAAERAPQDLVTAREKLARADQAASAGQNTDARRLAEEAQADAQLAAARSRNAAATAVLNQAEQGNTTLQQEMQRKTNTQ